ncbi:MAG: peptide chain release factor N(5)-glutamine methyltransferase [Treponema sp.]|nr:peptide chain release factor N(5)-glutamine methyltransferase [Treponema sp.]
MTIQEIRLKSIESLRNSNLKNFPEQLRTISLDSDIIISHILQKNRTWILFHRSEEVPKDKEEKIFSLIEQRKTGLPIAYITGHKEFFGLDFLVTRDVLIPKPDTELLVEKTIAETNTRAGARICDMCSGSGCAGISVVKNAPSVSSVTFADISEKALEITRINAERLLGTDEPSKKIFFVLSDLFSSVAGCFDIIITNPPYVPHTTATELLKDGRSEPILALDGDVDEKGENARTDDGLSIIRRLVPQCFEHISEKGVLLMETGEYNAQETALLFEKCGFARVHIEKDMNDMMRVVIGYKK